MIKQSYYLHSEQVGPENPYLQSHRPLGRHLPSFKHESDADARQPMTNK